jgi:hypothetical protein
MENNDLDNFYESSNYLDALGEALETEIKFITHCDIRVKQKEINKEKNKGKNNKEKINHTQIEKINDTFKEPFMSNIICLGEEEIFLFKKDMKKPYFKFNYGKIEYITLILNNPYQILINLLDTYQEIRDNEKNNRKNKHNIPYIYLNIPERNFFIQNLKCVYSNYFILYQGKIKNLKMKSLKEIEFIKISRNNYKKFYTKPPGRFKYALKINYRYRQIN